MSDTPPTQSSPTGSYRLDWRICGLPVAFLLVAVELQRHWNSPARWYYVAAALALGAGWLVPGEGRERNDCANLLDVVLFCLAGAALAASVAGHSEGTLLANSLATWSPLICAWWAIRLHDDLRGLAGRTIVLLLAVVVCLSSDAPPPIDRLIIDVLLVAAIRAAMLLQPRPGSAKVSAIDTDTGVASAYAFEAELAHTAAIANRYDLPLSLIACDIRGTCAKDAEAAMVKAFAWTLADCVRQADTVCRWADRKFVILLPNTRRADATEVARKIASAGSILLARTDASLVCLCGIAEHRPGDDPMQTFASAENELAPAIAPCPI